MLRSSLYKEEKNHSRYTSHNIIGSQRREGALSTNGGNGGVLKASGYQIQLHKILELEISNTQKAGSSETIGVNKIVLKPNRINEITRAKKLGAGD